jgi:hypothetical protein
MQQPANREPLPPSTNFAGMLAALASPPVENPEPQETWSESNLGDDVVTLSYERALRAHARYQRADHNNSQPEAATRFGEKLTLQTNQAPPNASDCDLRTASVTVRLSKAECASLHRRAAEAGLTVSAYLRSCTMEAEALRTQVKEALAGLRSTSDRIDRGPIPDNAEAANQRAACEVRLSRVIGRIGKLCLGISTGKSI